MSTYIATKITELEKEMQNAQQLLARAQAAVNETTQRLLRLDGALIVLREVAAEEDKGKAKAKEPEKDAEQAAEQAA
jgi:hypothetical protein